MKRFVVFCCLFFVCLADDREGKFFFAPKRQTVVSLKRVPEVITEFVPSSCFVIEPTLLPCRHVRNLEIYPSIPTRIAKTQTPQIQNNQPVEAQNWKPLVHSSESHTPTPPLRQKPQIAKNPTPHWNWNLLNIFRVENVTYTTTKTEFITTRIEDPNTVVSFYIRGCRPSRLPFYLPECPRAVEKTEQENIVVMAPLKFVPSEKLSEIVPSKPENVTKIIEKEERSEEDAEATTTTTDESI